MITNKIKTLFALVCACLVAQSWPFDLEKSIKDILDKRDIQKKYVYQNGPHNGELNYAKLFSSDDAKPMIPEFRALGVTVEVLNDSTVALTMPNHFKKIIVGGSDIYYTHPSMGKCEVLSWLPINDKFHRKAKEMKCADGTYIETNPDGTNKKTIRGNMVSECLAHWQNYVHGCKVALLYERGYRNKVDKMWFDSLTGKEVLRQAGNMNLRVVDYHPNGLGKTYKNEATPNQLWMTDTLGSFTEFVLHEGGFKYITKLPQTDGRPMLYMTNDSIKFNPHTIYILNNDMQIVDSINGGGK